MFKRLRKVILLNPKNSKKFLKSLSCIYNEGGFLQNAVALDRLALALDSREAVRAFIVRTLKKEERFFKFDLLRLMFGIGGFEEELRLYFEQNSLYRNILLFMAGGIGEPALFLLEKAFETGDPELQAAAVFAARQIGEPALPLLEKAFETGNPELQKKVVSSAVSVGESALFLLEKVFETGNPELQAAAVSAARLIGEPALPLLEKAFETGNPELHKKIIKIVPELVIPIMAWMRFIFKTDNPGSTGSDYERRKTKNRASFVPVRESF